MLISPTFFRLYILNLSETETRSDTVVSNSVPGISMERALQLPFCELQKSTFARKQQTWKLRSRWHWQMTRVWFWGVHTLRLLVDHCSSSERKNSKPGIRNTTYTSVAAKLSASHSTHPLGEWSIFIYSKRFTATLEIQSFCDSFQSVRAQAGFFSFSKLPVYTTTKETSDLLRLQWLWQIQPK